VNVWEKKQIPFWSGAVGRVSGIGRTVTELLLKQDMAVRAMVRNEDERAQHMSAEVVVGDLFDPTPASRENMSVLAAASAQTRRSFADGGKSDGRTED
jgi:hypothetical protein